MPGYSERYQMASNGELKWYRVVPSRSLRGTELIAALNWCESHCGRSRYVHNYSTGFFFEDQQHAFEFSLRWG
jgi:hypothetical protein